MRCGQEFIFGFRGAEFDFRKKTRKVLKDALWKPQPSGFLFI
jgi:hypothetical protein